MPERRGEIYVKPKKGGSRQSEKKKGRRKLNQAHSTAGRGEQQQLPKLLKEQTVTGNRKGDRGQEREGEEPQERRWGGEENKKGVKQKDRRNRQ